jgi:formate dehydrogenase maturation protein FdhE
MMRVLLVSIVALGICATAALAVPPAEDAVRPDEVVAEVTARHLEVLAGLIEKVPASALEKIEKAIEASQRGREKALEALAKAKPAADEAQAAMGGTTARGLERAIEAIESSTDRSTAQLESLLAKVPEEAASAIAAAIDRIESGHARALANLEGLLGRGVSVAHPSARPDVSGRPEVTRPERPISPGEMARPEIVRPARPEPPVLPERPARP